MKITKNYIFRQVIREKNFLCGAVCYVTGSDQVWHNWHSTDGTLDKYAELKYFYLMFAPREKRIAYAPSFGFYDFPKDDIKIHQKGIKGFEDGKISVREKRGAELIKEITGKEIPVVPDPTLLLYQEDWDKIAQKPEYDVPEHFVLQYFLGDKKEYDIDLPIIDVYDINNEEYYTKTGPSEFIWLMKHCDYVCTDSFHACVFSIIYHNDFTVFKRTHEGKDNHMFDRIETLLENTGLEQCVDNVGNHTIDWARVDAEIDRRRKIGIDFLENALNIGKDK